jgi:hypothetical protein
MVPSFFSSANSRMVTSGSTSMATRRMSMNRNCHSPVVSVKPPNKTKKIRSL